MRRASALVALLLGSAALVLCAQSTDASLSGQVADPSRARIVDAKVAAIRSDTNSRYETTTNALGEYDLPNLPPSAYRIEIEAPGFKKLIETAVVLHVQDAPNMDFKMTVGAASDSVTVEGGAPLLKTSDASVSTLIGNQFVESLPLNGRSFTSLIALTPGVALTPANQYEQGQFSVNGQRPDANYFLVDGVSANLGSGSSNLGQGGAGQLPATSAFGGASNLVSLDALEEFRIETSTFAPEYGSTPGAQVSVVTKSGTNVFHGTAFEYFRNDVVDANDWFADHDDLPKSPLRQNDFGGVLGGPILKDNLFFFGSYEAVRVRQPLVADTYVPTLTTRQSAPAAVQPLLNAFPRPTRNGQDFGDGTAAFTAGYSDPSSLDSSSLRVDYLPIRRLTFFARYSDAPSSIAQRGGGHFQTEYSNILHTMDRFQSLTLGGNQTITGRLVNEVRFNYSRSRGESFLTLDNFGGAAPPPYSALYPSFASSNSGFFSFYGDFNPFGLNFDTGKIADNLQHQINVTDSLSRVIGTHQLKFGLDYRRLRPEENALTYQLEYEFGSLQAVLADSVAAAFIGSRTADVQLIISNWSLFAQDIWNVAHSVTITYGLRWEYNLAPTSPNGTLPFTVTGLDNLATAQLAPPGTPLWHSQKDDFAPRLGVAWRPRSNLVFRAGAGVFYDLGYSDVTDAMTAFPYAQDELIFGTSFPLSNSAAMPPPFTTSPPADYLAVVDPNHFLPRTYEWNAALEQSLGKSNVLTITYVGAGGRKLMRQNLYNAPNPEFSGEFDLMRNGATSDYDALQTQFRRHLSHGLQTLLSYTWGHSIDDVSSDVYFLSVPPGDSPESGERGPSDYDIRNTFSGAVSFDIPSPREGIAKPILENWSTDSIIYARSAPPVNVVTGQDPFKTGFLSGAYGVTRPNLIPGVPLYLNEPNAPGGKSINAAAFSIPTSPAQGNLGRNALRGFGATQLDLTLRRKFQIMERLALQARGDLFNIFNHPNFGPQTNYLSSPLFGQSTQMLAGSLGSGGQGGGLNPLYQVGGPRSIQLALKLEF